MANVLPAEKRVRVLAALLDGNSIRAVERMTEVNHRTITRLLLALGAGAVRLHDRLVRDVQCSLVQVDEIWSFVQKKQARVTEADPPDVGEAYTFVAIDATSRMVISWRVGKRDQATTDAFIADLRARMLVMPQLTSDGFAPYIPAVGASFGTSIDYMQTVKNYRSRSRGRRDDHRYEPPRDPFITKSTVYGAPDPAKASTSYVERLNGSTRHTNGRMRRLYYAFSKKGGHHAAAVALNYVAYNLTRVIRTLRVTPAMQAGITDHVWTLDELLDTLLAEEEHAAPEAKPLTHREPSAPARALPGGRGFLRLVTELTPALKRPPHRSEPPPPAVPPVQAAPTPPAEPQRGMVQLDLFGAPPEES
ncbi:transposase [Sorangium cellulosum]|uniref:Transposase n=1 Tax=Sorangium cellulosum TaxID=56 RepID=A0A150R6S6_SORCE|nr:transposase [Sorangium cellulosum]